MEAVRSTSCDRTRLWLSLRLDGELSELESRLLGAHLVRCAACRAYEQGVQETTAALRAAPLVSAARPVSLPRARRRSVGALRIASAAAAFAAVALTGVLTLSASSGRERFLPGAAPVRDVEVSDLRRLRRAELVPQAPAPPFRHVQLPGRDEI